MDISSQSAALTPARVTIARHSPAGLMAKTLAVSPESLWDHKTALLTLPAAKPDSSFM
ncbi:hypothetical protein [Anaerohalosphaera lusitana]|uniref:hypothetical protein n=1 Tax=Anaerohalosphaera lusitana TaxID=1936003 RepID=UPI00197BC362|nr:hypothetical protein [Anaerohalosphaera lusitana]